MARNLYAHRDLIWRFALRDVQGRYKGSYLGMLWSFITPLLMLSVYTFVFGVVLRTRWDGQTGNGSLEFSLIMFSGLIVFSVFSDCLARAPALIVTTHPVPAEPGWEPRILKGVGRPSDRS